MLNSELIESNYALKVLDIRLLDKHFGTEIYIIETAAKKYIVKVLPPNFGNIEKEGLKSYIRTYTKHFPLSEYDIKAMPYVLYFWHCVCNYRPDELACIAETYQSIAILIQKMLNWLYVHVEELAEALE